MGIGLKGQNLIFLISQPRAGSTMLQRILGSHPDMHTVSEPWLMLPAMIALTGRWCNREEREARFARENVQAFLKTLPCGDDEYFEGLRRMYTYLYDCALESSEKRYFLDKTPRYAYIIPELYRTFPEAHFIILLRNPLAVLCSVVKTWTGYDRRLLSLHRDDLDDVPGLLLEGIEMLGAKCVIVHYEELVGQPETEVQKICEKLGIEFFPEMIEYNRHNLPQWRFGDSLVYQHTRPVAKKAESWRSDIRHPLMWRLANKYLGLLGRETIEKMEYSYHELQQILEASRPHWSRRWFAYSRHSLRTFLLQGRVLVGELFREYQRPQETPEQRL